MKKNTMFKTNQNKARTPVTARGLLWNKRHYQALKNNNNNNNVFQFSNKQTKSTIRGGVNTSFPHPTQASSGEVKAGTKDKTRFDSSMRLFQEPMEEALSQLLRLKRIIKEINWQEQKHLEDCFCFVSANTQKHSSHDSMSQAQKKFQPT